MWDVGTASLTNKILFIRATNGRPYVILSFCRPSVNFVDCSPQWEPKKPLLEERWHEVTECWYFYHSLTKPPIFHIILIYKKKGMIFMEYNRANAVAYAKSGHTEENPKYYDFSDFWAVIVQTLRHSAYMRQRRYELHADIRLVLHFCKQQSAGMDRS